MSDSAHEIKLSPEEIEEYRDAFDLADRDGSGTISNKEFMRMLKNIGMSMSEKQANALMNEIDKDHSGYLDFNEFVSYMTKVRVQEQINEEDAIIRAFQFFDTNKNGELSIEEFTNVLCKLGRDPFNEYECQEIFKAADIDNNQSLNYREFVAYWRNK